MIDVRTLASTKEVRVLTDSGYFPVVRPTGPESAIMVIRAGAGHIGLGGRLEVLTTTNCGVTWSDPIVAADSERDDRNPALAAVGDMITVAYFHNGSYDSDGKYQPGGPVDTLVVQSSDGGKTWGEAKPLSFTDLNGASPYGQIVTASDGTLLMPIYSFDNAAKTAESWLLRSDDSGTIWENPTLIAKNFNETSLLYLGEHRILAALRHQIEGTAPISVSHSSDDGKSWTTPVQVTGDSEHPADIVRLSNGWILMTHGYRNEPYGVRGLISTDGGHTWLEEKLLYADHSPREDCGYPSSVVFANGMVMTAYYSAGPDTTYHDPSTAHCNVLVYSENELIQAVKAAV